MSCIIQHFFDPVSSTFSYVVHHPQSLQCAIIDSVLGYDPISARTNTQHADQIIQYIQTNNLQLEWILETHIHADHFSAATYIKKNLGGKIGVSKHIKTVYQNFLSIYNLPDQPLSQFDYLFEDNEEFDLCGLNATALYVPGHTPADLAFKVEENIFVGDTLFAKDVGTARCDFPGGNAHQLYLSIQKILSYPDETKLYLCHDYPPSYRKHLYQTTVSEQKLENIHIKQGIIAINFVDMRVSRDTHLKLPQLMVPALQINLCAGALPEITANGVQYLKIPLNIF